MFEEFADVIAGPAGLQDFRLATAGAIPIALTSND
jgi:hypothetical protein